MTETGGSPPVRTAKEPATVSTLVAWRRTGLIASVVGLLCLLAGFVALSWDLAVLGGISVVAGIVAVLVGYGFLQRAWSDPLVAADPSVVRIQRAAGVAAAGWGLALLVRFAVLVLPDGLDWLRWVGLALGVVGVLAYLVVLALVVRWSPARD